MLGQNHPDFAQSLANLGVLYHALGDYAQAEPLLRQGLEIRRRVLGENHPDVPVSLNGLATLYQSLPDYAQAEPLFQQALEIRRRVLGESHPDFGRSVNNLGVLYRAMGEYAQAEPLYRQASEVFRAALGENHPDFATSLANLAELSEAMGDYAQAERLFRQALEIRRRVFGDNHADFAQSLHDLAILLVARSRPADAFPLMQQAMTIDNRMIQRVFAIGSDRQRLAFLRTGSGRFQAFLSLVLHHCSDSPPAIQTALDLLLQRKAVAAEALAAQRDTILGGRYPHLDERFRQLGRLRQEIARDTLAGPAPGQDPIAHDEHIATLEGERERLEKELARQVPEVNLQRHMQGSGRRAVALGLPAGVALVEFVRFLEFDFHAITTHDEPRWKPARYLAFVLPAREPESVHMIDLGEAEPIDELIADFRLAITRDPDELRRDPADIPDPQDGTSGSTLTGSAALGDTLRKAVFDPVAAVLGECKRLFLAPDGDLSRLPFEALPTFEGRRLIDEYTISYLSSGRDVLRLGITPTRTANAALIAADPDFDLLAPASKPSRRPGFFGWLFRSSAEVSSPAPTSNPTNRISRDFDRGPGVSRLPGTRVEGERIAALLGVEPLLEGNVLDHRLKAIRSPRILHLATHGFFLRDQQIDPDDTTAAHLENPLLRSGILLAGYNTWRAGGRLPREAEDGVLTAEEVTGMDLLDTELVVLSACETGLGHIQAGEGVFGLRRAFIQAGAKTLVMSLWKVPDQQTQELMVDFYSRILRGEPRAEALRQAQLAIRERYPHPYFWGAFICQGDPNPLRG